MKTLMFLFLLIIPLSSYSQNESDYFKSRFEFNKSNKIKTIETYAYDENNPSLIEYISEEGYPVKIEIFTSENQLYSLIDEISVLENKLISYTQTEFGNPSNPIKFKIENLPLTMFYQMEFGESTVTEVRYILDDGNSLIEKKIFAEDIGDEAMNTEKFFYDENNRIKYVKIYSESGLLETAYYDYDSQNLLTKITYRTNDPSGEFITTFRYTFY